MKALARKSGFASVAELHASEIGPLLKELTQGKKYAGWTRTSKERFKFDTIVRNCSSEVGRFLDEIVQVFEFLINPQNDL